jgi:biopolymer transport protein ExbD
MFFQKKQRRSAEEMDLDITSLLDVLVILLVFLLKSYNASDLKVNLVNDLTIPNSDTRKLGNHAVIVQVDKNQNLYVNSKQIGLAKAQSNEIKALTAALKDLRDKDLKPENKKDKKINLIFDKNIPYKTMKSVMNTSALVGYTEFKFIVQGNY